MKAFIAQAPKNACFVDVEIPPLESDQVLIKVKYAGICGTDYAIYTGQSSFVENGLIQYPVRFGHEWSGVVEKFGRNVLEFKEGDRVIGDNVVSCGCCAACNDGDYDNCVDKKCVGTINCWDGCFADYIIMPKWHTYKLADNTPLIEGAFAEPLSVAYGGIKRMNITDQSVVAVIGTGCIGMSAVALAKQKGAKKVIMVGRNQYKLDIARKVGADAVINTSQCDLKAAIDEMTGKKGVEYVLECSGVKHTVMSSVGIASQNGVIALIGFYETMLNDIDIDLFVSKQLTMFGVMGEYGNLAAVNEIMAESDLRLSQMITAQVPFSQISAAFENETKNHGKSIKTIIVMD